MDQTRCPYCHEMIDNGSLAAHTAQHRALQADGQQKDYATLPPEERYDKNLIGVPTAYVHGQCGVATRMPDEIIRSYLQNPYLYLADTTFCVGCGRQVPYAECTWSQTGENLQQYFDALRAEKPECRPAGLGGVANRPSAPSTNPAPASSSFSGQRVVIGLIAVIGLGALAKLPRAFKKLADNQAGQVQPDNQAAQAEVEDWRGKLKRGEDVPAHVLILAGIDPNKYKLIQVEMRVGKLLKEGQYIEALKALDHGLSMNSDVPDLQNSKAWLLATCKDESIRNGKLAVEHAVKACELTAFEDPVHLDTLAAAHAEAADFESAVKFEQAAIERTKDEPQSKRFAARLELYKVGMPFHE